MVLSKRERVLRTLENDGEPDKVPIFHFGFEQTSTTFQAYQNSKEKEESVTWVQPEFSKVKYYISEQRFWNVDLYRSDPFGAKKFKMKNKKAPLEYPDCRIDTMDGRIFKTVKQIDTGLDYTWYVDGYFKTPEIMYSYWDRYGRPSELLNDRINYSPKIWEAYVDALAPYYYPMANLHIEPVTSLYCGMTFGRLAYYMRKKPQFIHEVMNEYTTLTIELIKRFAEAGVDIVNMGDDLAYKENTFFSLKHFREFFLPYYKKMIHACKKNGMIYTIHTDGKIDEYLPDLVDAGLQAVQALEASAGVDLEGLKERLGDRLCFIGGLDSSGVLTFGTPKDVEEDVKKCIKVAGHGGGYFVGTSNDVLNAPYENVLAMRAAIEKYREYPLNF
ncbi:MAG: uroporphyrinogen decarboxylase family protein [Promethearchaeota archaeon]